MEIFNQRKREREDLKAVFRHLKDSWVWMTGCSGMLPREEPCRARVARKEASLSDCWSKPASDLETGLGGFSKLLTLWFPKTFRDGVISFPLCCREICSTG